jgi:hypothetical protein
MESVKAIGITAAGLITGFVLGMRAINAYDLRCQRRDKALYGVGAYEHAPHTWDAVTAANQAARRHWWGRVLVPEAWDGAQIMGAAEYRAPFTTETGRVIQ